MSECTSGKFEGKELEVLNSGKCEAKTLEEKAMLYDIQSQVKSNPTIQNLYSLFQKFGYDQQPATTIWGCYLDLIKKNYPLQ